MTATDKTEKKRAIVIWDIAKLIPYPKNPKKHLPEQVTRLARSIDKLGITPIMVEGNQEGCTPGMIIAGHGRRLSLLELGRTKAPVDVRDDLTKIECDALRIADNAGVSTEMDYDMMTSEVLRLQEEGFDLNSLAMTDAEITSITVPEVTFDDTAFTTDITAAVEDKKAKNKETESEIDGKEGPIAEAFGFKKVTTEQSRAIRGFMAKVEEESGLKGAEALIAHINAS